MKKIFIFLMLLFIGISISFAKSLPHEVLGITLGTTTKTQAIKKLESQGFGLASTESNQLLFIGSTVRNGVEWNLIGLIIQNGVVTQVSYSNLYDSQNELASALLKCGPKYQSAYGEHEVPTNNVRSMMFKEKNYYINILTSYENGFHYLVVSYGIYK